MMWPPEGGLACFLSTAKCSSLGLPEVCMAVPRTPSCALQGPALWILLLWESEGPPAGAPQAFPSPAPATALPWSQTEGSLVPRGRSSPWGPEAYEMGGSV